MTLRPATLDDLDAIAALEDAGFDHARWSAHAWADEITGADRHVLVAAEGEQVVGVVTFQSVAGDADLHRVIVRADQQGRGLARALVRAGLDWAADRGAERVLLEVEHDNHRALRLYDGLGFETIARRADYYGTGRHALVMSLALTAPEQRTIA